MTSIVRKLIGWTGVGLNLAGMTYFVKWALKTDFMFGHSEGPPEFLFKAIWFLIPGVAVSILWFVLSLSVLIRSRRLGAGMKLRVLKWFLCGAPVVVLMLVAVLGLLMGLSALPRAQLKARRAVPAKLVDQGSKGVPGLIQALSDKDWYVRMAAAEALAEMGTDAAPAIDALVQAAERREELTSWFAATALGNIGPPAIKAVPALVGLLDADEVLIWKCGEALAKIGPEALPAVIAALSSDDSRVRVGAVKALAEFGIAPAEVRLHLIRLLEDPVAEVRAEAAKSLAVVDTRVK